MGYFKYKLRRGICLARKRERLNRFAPVPLPPSPAPRSASGPRRFVRLVASHLDTDTNQHAGVFQTAYDLLESGELTRDEIRAYARAMRWFNKYVYAPEWLLTPRAIFWFKAEAEDCVRNIWNLVSLLRGHGRHVRLIVTREPGAIVYEDEHQIASVPRRRC
jgi:hypothetical protein